MKLNEDFARAGGGVLVLADGAGVPRGAAEAALRALGRAQPNSEKLFCSDGVLWYVNDFGPRLHELAGDRNRPLTSAVRQAIEETTAAHADCPAGSVTAPSATVIVARENAGQLEYLVLADSSLVLDYGDSVEQVTDPRNDQLDAKLRRRLDSLPRGSAEHHDEFGRYWLRHCELRNNPDGYWVASDNPDAADHAITGSVPLRGLEGIALLSDGAARAADMFGSTWREVMDVCRDNGPMALINEVRAQEKAAAQKKPAGWKLHDDATAIYVPLGAQPGGIWRPGR